MSFGGRERCRGDRTVGMADRVGTSQQQSSQSRPPDGGGPVSLVELIDRLGRFDGPPEQFLANLLAVQCHISASAGGAMLRPGPEGRAEVLAVYPALVQGQAAPAWLAQAVEGAGEAASQGSTVVRPVHGPEDLYGQAADSHLVMVPLRAAQGVRGVSAFLVEGRDGRGLAWARERIELTGSLLSLYEMRLTLQQRQGDLRRLRMAMETLSSVNEHDRFAGAAMAFCNEVASRWEAEHVSVGFLKGRYVYLKAMSHTEKFIRKMALVQDLESAMEECLDQDVEVIHPPGAEASYVSRASRELSVRHGSISVLSLPLRKAGEPVGVVTLERPADRPFKLDEIEPLRLACELCTVRLANLHEQDRWAGARLASACRGGLTKLVGPTHTWVKVTVAAALAAILLVTLGRGDYTAEGTFVIEPLQQQLIQAPYDGHLASVSVEPGDVVAEGQELARLDAEDLLSRLAEKQAERASYRTQVEQYEAEGRSKAYERSVAQAEVRRVEAQVQSLEYQVGKAILRSPVAGTVLSGDLKRQLGATMQTGQQMFEIAPLAALRATVSIPEDQIAEVRKGGSGELATALYPGRRIAFEVERVIPVAEAVQGNNVFKVRVRLKDLDLPGRHAWLRPGMEGVGKVELGRRSYAYLWSRRLVNWLRMKLWW